MSHRPNRSIRRGLAATFALCLAAAGLFVAGPARAEVQITFEPGGVPLDLDRPVEVKQPRPEYTLTLPYYVVDQNSPSGLTTLFAVRNRSSQAETIEIVYFDEQGIERRRDLVDMDANETVTLNLRNIPGLPVADGISQGTVLIALIDPVSQEIETRPVLTGDFFFVDPDDNFASGDVLADTLSGYCMRWDTRFFNGGPFSGGTDFVYLLPNGPDVGGVIAEGNVYDESGVFQGTATIESNGEISGVVDTSSVQGLLPSFGTVEWRFSDDNMGIMMVVFSAEDRYSVGSYAYCVD